MMEVYILKNCDTCRKAVKWLETQNTPATIIDIRADGIKDKTIAAAIAKLGWQAVLNRRSTTWRNLQEAQKTGVDADKAIDLIAQNPTLMKRPLFIIDDEYLVGFSNATQTRLCQLIA